MSKIDEKEIERRFEEISQFQSRPGVIASDLDRARECLAKRTSERQTKDKVIWKIIIKSRIVKLATAAGLTIAILVGARWFGAEAPAYGITEALELWENAETVHIKGWKILNTGDSIHSGIQKFPFELWLDKGNGRFRYWRPNSCSGIYTSKTPRYNLTVSDGQYIMEISGFMNMDGSNNVNSDDKSDPPLVRFTKLSPFEQCLRIRTMAPFPEYIGNLNQVSGFGKVWRERLNDRMVDVWEGKITSAGPYPIKKTIWLSPETGEIIRISTVIILEESPRRGRLGVTVSLTDTIEYDVVPPANCFNTDPPAGHKQMNTKETAVERELRDGDGDAKFYSCIGFTLKDGSVIYGWHANRHPEESQANLFTGLKPGGPLPSLPAQVVGLRPWPTKKDIILTGRHLAFTRKKGKFYEWGIYVPDEKTPERNKFASYKIISKYNFGPRPFFDGRPDLLGSEHELTINSEQEFDTWVRGAMAELSDDGKAPESITYKKVLQLAEKIRNTLKR